MIYIENLKNSQIPPLLNFFCKINLHYSFSLEKYVKYDVATWFVVDLTENIVKLNVTTWFAFDLTENFMKLNLTTSFAFAVTEKLISKWIQDFIVILSNIQSLIHLFQIEFEGLFLLDNKSCSVPNFYSIHLKSNFQT